MPDTVPDPRDSDAPDVERGYRFATIPEWVLYHPHLTAAAIRVYGCLDRRGQTPSDCYPSHADIAERAQMSERSVARPLAELAAAGAIQIVPRFVEGRQTSNGYRLAGDAPFPLPLSARESATAPAQERGSGRAGERAPGRAQERDERESEEREPEEREDSPALFAEPEPPAAVRDPVVESAEFIEFYDRRYPRRVGRGAARRAWANAVKKAPPGIIIAGAVHFAEQCKRRGTETTFIPHPSTWLNGERWRDEDRAAGPSSGPRVAIVDDGPSGRVVDL